MVSIGPTVEGIWGRDAKVRGAAEERREDTAARTLNWPYQRQLVTRVPASRVSESLPGES